MFDRGYQISRRCCFLSQYLQHLARKKEKTQSAPVMNRKSENRSKRVKNGTGFHKKSPKVTSIKRFSHPSGGSDIILSSSE